ncbi:1,4-alpha-glucan branching protein domain-containing protein [Alicyclobacillus ferrooxydans]|uniref:Glycosyl transferase family 1 n=1 Tax=Alicyclobacillus ferrooxydans TaxID=471514 RepID=A0A0P9CUP2_9BACL|nr:1,4-alpha-glucan branching protein domain-containing protein [Alicyclobacillus ferrooxydans]KPV43425.1 glycosyl transferase family 1 [Alicyclobacillus ferrooxydans]
MAEGYLAVVLHAHLPYVHHPESEKYLEERWLFEAITETYIPLLQVYKGLIQDGVDFRVTMSITPTLAAMLADEMLQERYATHLSRLIELAEKEVRRTKDMPEFYPLARQYWGKFLKIQEFYLRYKKNLLTAFREIQDAGKLEIITCAATHAFLPLIWSEEALRAQIATAVLQHTVLFGKAPRGIWLPECGYTPMVDGVLKEYGIDFFFVDSHGVLTAEPTPVQGTLSPVVTPNGIAAFARDEESAKQVWSAVEGYPGDFDYREYYRDIGYDLDDEYVKPYIHPEGIRVNTGIKYYRITGKGDHKEPYHFSAAAHKAAEHAGNFMFNREKQVKYHASRMNRLPIVVAPYDAELFGHWWYEGPVFLDMLFRKIFFDSKTIEAITPSEYLDLYPDYQVCQLPMSSWGRDGYADVWLRGENDWIYPALHMAEQRMIELANRHFHVDGSEKGLTERALKQAARELMLAESSDFAFIMDSKTMVDYAVKRTKHHINRFSQLYEMIQQDQVDEQWLSSLEELDNLFPDIDYQVYQSRYPVMRYEAKPALRILMLSWEFPPLTIGGLSRHVYDLSRYLVKQGVEVHVLTMSVEGYPDNEIVDGVHVHRVHVMKPDGAEFIHYIFQLNLMMVDACQTLIHSGLRFDLVHAHDWLVADAGEAIKHLYDLPLIATIHATEHGRNHGLHTDLQHQIHHQEWELTYEAWRVIVCSQYMQREVETIFQLPHDKVHVLPNGVDPQLLDAKQVEDLDRARYAHPDEPIVLFVGRLVREKGVHILLEAAPLILSEYAHCKFVIVGAGPMETELRYLANRQGIVNSVQFTGFVSDEERNYLLHVADIAAFPSLYEPFGIVALEAMAAGTPVVVSDVGGLADVVAHERNGLKMYAGDPQSLANQVKVMLQNREGAKTLAETALAEIGRYDWNNIAYETLKIYQGILAEKDSLETPLQVATGSC